MEQRLISLLSDLVAINSVNLTLSGGAGEREIAEHIQVRLAGFGLDAALQKVDGDRANTVALIRGKNRGTSLLLNGHIDTVGVEGMESPFSLRRDGDRLYGRGAYDMKGSIAVMLALAEHFAKTPPAGDVWLTFVADEEDRSLGTDYLVRNWLPILPSLPWGAIFLEPTEENTGVAHKGFSWFEVEIFGKAAHGSRPELGIDAIMPLRAALTELDIIRSELSARTPDLLLGCPSLHGGIIRGGTELSVIPAHASLQWERRTLPDEKPESVSEELIRVARAVERLPEGHRVKQREIFRRLPYRCPPDAEILNRLKKASPGSKQVGLSFWADSALMGFAGVPSLLFGPVGHGAHAVDEWVSLKSLVKVYDVLKRVTSCGK
jgi:acetylornithine deacetylase